MPATDGAQLVLEATGPEAERLAGGRRKEFASGELGASSSIPRKGTIGRAEDNDWVLPHPLVSGYHAAIKYANGVFYITDTSTNGVFLTSRTNRLIKGQPYPISNGDIIIIEPFRIEASVASARASDVAAGPPERPLIPREPLLSPEPLIPPERPFIPPELPLNVEPREPPPPGWGADPFGSTEDQFRGQMPPLVPSSQPDELDPLKALFGDDAGPIPPGPPPPRLEDLERAGPLNDVLPPVRVGRTEPPSSPPAPLIPIDYDPLADSGGSSALPPSGREPPPRPRVDARASQPAPIDPLPQRPRQDVQSPPPRSQQPDAGTAVLAAVLAGAGLPNAVVTPQLARNLGEILRVVVEGVMEALQARQEVKGEFRMQGTIVRQVGNNALKFSANVNDALHNLLVKQNPAYLGPVEAFQDAFRDLRNHEMAMLAGMRAAFESMLAEFSPERLQSQFDRTAKKGLLGAKPDYWELYRQRAEDLARDPEDAFRKLFGERFVRAYQEQLDRLNEQGRARKP